jgi:hypothetical protein
MLEDEEKMEYEAEPIENIFVSFDEDNKVFYVEINEEYGFTLDPQQFMEFVNKSIVVINEVIHDNFNSSIKSLMNATHKKALKKIEEGDEQRAVDDIEEMLKTQRDDDGPVAA